MCLPACVRAVGGVLQRLVGLVCYLGRGEGGSFEFHSLFYGGPQPMEAAL